MKTWAMTVLIAALLSGCGREKEPGTQTVRLGDARRGRALYLTNCAACHNSDPSKDGTIGPAVKGASRELIEARVMRATYPPDYKPKRKTAAMPAQPYLASSIPDLAAFLNPAAN